MLHAIRQSKAVPAVLSAMIVLGMWSNAMAAVFCPHMMGGSDSCFMQNAKAHSDERGSDASTSMTHDDMDHTHMSDMDMQNMHMDMAGVQMDDGITSQPKLDLELLSNGAVEITPNNQLTAETITQPNEPCSHCMMH